MSQAEGRNFIRFVGTEAEQGQNALGGLKAASTGGCADKSYAASIPGGSSSAARRDSLVQNRHGLQAGLRSFVDGLFERLTCRPSSASIT